MNCPACSHENRPGAKFCEECAAPLKRVCASCGAELRPTAKFCDECAEPSGLGGPATAQPRLSAQATGARKVVSVVFADLAGSTALHERIDAESAHRLMERYYETLRTVVEDHGGTVVKLLGDGVMAAFGVPQVAEDDAIRAVRAGAAMQEAFRTLVREQAAALGEVGLRVAINTGEVVVSSANDDVVGDPVNVAARLQQEARDGDVVIGEATHRLVATLVTLEKLGSFTLKGRAEPVKAYRVASLERPAGVAATPFVGREDELARITRVYEAAINTPAARLAVLVGSPGLGKSRLVAEFVHRQSDTATIVFAHCNATGSATFAPLADALRELFAIDEGTTGAALRDAVDTGIPGDESDRKRIVDGITALLSGESASPEETFFVVRRALAALATLQPVVLVIDDLQWAEPLLLDLVEHLIQWGKDVPLLVLAGARPELRDNRSSMVTPGGLVADVVTLAGLDARAAMRLAASVIGAADLPAAVAAKVLATSEGNPLFVGELVRMLVEEGAIERQGDRWVIGAGLAELEMPPTIHALLAARIERLRAEDRVVLERAAVVGRQFSRSAVAELLPGAAADLDSRLESLRRSELIERDTGWLLGEPGLRFHHVLIRDAAYRRVLKGTRAELHARFADWVKARAGESVEHDETIGWHLEQAHQHLGELGPIDAAGRELGERASSYLAAAGKRALAGDDVSLAASLFGRALARLDDDDSSRAELALLWCESLLASGEVGSADAALDELARFTADSPRLRAWHTCFTSELAVHSAPQSLTAAADSVAAAAEELAGLDDTAGEAKAHFVHAQALASLGKVGACEAALDKALAAARKAGDRRRANAVLAGAPLAALWGPSPVTRASGRCLDVVRVLRITHGAPDVEAVALSCQGVLEALRGRTDAARRMIASARKLVEELGVMHRLFQTDVFAARIDLLEGNAANAERTLRSAYEGLRGLGLGTDAAQVAALLARALLDQGRAEEAEKLSHESEALAGDDLKAAIAWRGARAEALAVRGEVKAAVELAEAAVAIAAATDAHLDHADARLALAAALRAAGRGTEADAEERRASELWEAKGATILAERSQREPRSSAATSYPEEPAVAPATAKAQRRVRANAATTMMARVEAAIRARELDQIDACLGDPLETIEHTTGATYGREGQLESSRRMIRIPGLTCRFEILGTLGETLCIGRRLVTASGTSGGNFDVADYEMDHIILNEVDQAGRLGRSEVFAPNSLGSAISRLYARYAELLPEGTERERAATIATNRQAFDGTIDLEVLATALDPACENIDHRTLATWSFRGKHDALTHYGEQIKLAEGFAARSDDILALTADTLVVRQAFCGTARDSGGAFENHVLVLSRFGPTGLVGDTETWEPHEEAAALARFDELTGAGEPARFSRRVCSNAATAFVARMNTAIRERDLDAIATLMPDDLEAVDHANGATYGRDGLIASAKSLMRVFGVDFGIEVWATLGRSLYLGRRRVRAQGVSGGNFDVADYEIVHFTIGQTDEEGKIRRSEVFASNHLGDAIARFYEMYAEQLPDGMERARAQTIGRCFTRAHGMPDQRGEDRGVLAPDFECVDHRQIGTWGMRGPEAWIEHMGALRAVADDIVFRTEDVLALEAAAVLVRRMHSGTDRRGGGAYERPLMALFVAGADGRLSRVEFFDVGHETEALARFDELTGTRSASTFVPIDARSADAGGARFVNAASRASGRLAACWRAHDWPGYAGILAEDFRFSDRRKVAQLELGQDQFVEYTRSLGDLSSTSMENPLIATRGDRLALTRLHVEVADEDVDASGFAAVDLTEVDEHGQVVSLVHFDTGDLDAAYAELDARFAAGEGRQHAAATAWTAAFYQAMKHHDWEAAAACYAPTFVGHDHRLVGWGTLAGRAAFLPTLQTMIELAPDARIRRDHVRMAHRGAIYSNMWIGTRDGGAFESLFVAVLELDESGLAQRLDFYDPHHVDAALARFEEIRAASPATITRRDPFANAATRMNERFVRAWEERDFDTLSGPLTPALGYDDRRKLLQTAPNHRTAVEGTRFLFDVPNSRMTVTPLATRGERLVLSRAVFEGTVDEEGGALAIDYLAVDEVDEKGNSLICVFFDIDDLDAAYDELDRRYVVQEEAAHRTVASRFLATTRMIETGAWSDVEAMLPPSFYIRDHRKLGWGTTLDSPATFVRSQRALSELAPDARYRVHHLRVSSHAHLCHFTQMGTRDGGDFENPMLNVGTWDASGRPLQYDLYDVEDYDAALAHFEKLSGGDVPSAQSDESSSDGVKVPAAKTRGSSGMPRSPGGAGTAIPIAANNASAAFRRWQEAFATGSETGDWGPMRQVCAPGMTFEDRQRFSLVSGDCELMIASARERVVSGARPHARVVGAAGDRVVVARILWSGGPTGGRFEIEYLAVLEADESGLVSAIVLMDADDPGAVLREAWARWQTIDPVATRWVELASSSVAWFHGRETDPLRTPFAESLVVDDHRLAGFGRIEGDKAYFDAVAVLRDLAPDTRLEVGWAWPAYDHRAAIATVLLTGHLASGGEFESEYLILYVIDGGLVTRIELFDTGHLDKALGRFEELRGETDLSGALRAPAIAPNAAIRAGERVATFITASGDWEGARAFYADDFEYEDRSRRSLVRGGFEELIAGVRYLVAEVGAQGWHEYIGTVGDRISIAHRAWRNAPGMSDFELDKILVTEVDAQGKFRAIILFDGDDRAAAFAEAEARGEALERAERNPVSHDSLRIPPNAATRTLDLWCAAVKARDVATAMALNGPALVVDDRRSLIRTTTGFEAEHRNIDTIIQGNGRPARTLLATAGERLALHRWLWTFGEVSAPSEVEFLEIDEVDDEGRFVWSVILDPDDRAGAWAALWGRYAQGEDRTADFLLAANGHDLERMRATLSDDFVLVDHRRTGMGRLESPEAYVASFAAVVDELSADYRMELLYMAASADHGSVTVGRACGTNAAGGEFESIIVAVAIFDGDGIRRFEWFEPEHLDRALARFEELRPPRA